jgi:cardiolipin synthase A/B
MLVAHTLGFVSSLAALMSTRTSQGTIAWIVSLNTIPYVAVPAYWAFGRTKFQGYVIARRDEESRLAQTLVPARATVEPLRARLSPERGAIRAVERLAKMPFLAGNRAELLIDGDATFANLFAGIDAAERYLLVQFYIVRDDDLGRELQRRLLRRARAGVEVRFLYDRLGSLGLSGSYLRELREGGVDVRAFHSTRGRGNRFQLNFRNHRKVMVADGRVGWLGGLNVGDEYLGRDPRFGAWRDTHLRLEGPAVLGLQLSFVEDWYWATGRILELDWTPRAAPDGAADALVLPTGPADRFETASLMVQHILHSAHRRVWISSPYFVPDEGVLAALKLAALRGVDVRVLIPERPDNLLVYLAAYAFLDPLLEAGVRIHRYEDGFLHGKALLVDDAGVGVGTVNLDNRSFRLNFEITALVIDPELARAAEVMFRDDFARAREMTREEIGAQPFLFRVASRAAYLTAPVL